MLAKGANIDTWPKLNIIMGRVKLKEESVKVKAVFISKNSGKKKNSFSKNFQV
jgi:hypothetical protein